MAREYARVKGARKARLRASVFDRDSWTCQDCGKVIPPRNDEQRAGQAAPMAEDGDWLELEHIVPFSAGGSDDESNLRAACTTCNRRKSNSLIRSGWAMRIDAAVEILTSRPPSRDTAERAIRILSEAVD